VKINISQFFDISSAFSLDFAKVWVKIRLLYSYFSAGNVTLFGVQNLGGHLLGSLLEWRQFFL